MKKLSLSLLLALIFSLIVSSVWAMPYVSFLGNYTLSDDPSDNDTFMETLSFYNPVGSGSGAISVSDPSDDAIFSDSDLEYITIVDLLLDPNNPYYFNPMVYHDGFAIYDDDNSVLLTADLTVEQIEITNSSGYINSALTMNLTNITPGSNYGMGSSVIIDSFLNAPGGALNITLQLSGDLGAIISNSGGNNGGNFTSTYSGSAAPVPEPATIMLFGIGLAGLGGWARKHRSKKN